MFAMKRNILILLCILFSLKSAFTQDIPEKKIETTVSEVTVFLDGAQIARKKHIDLPIGVTNLKFVKLSPYISAKSIRVKAKGNVMVQSVSHELNYLENQSNNNEAEKLHSKIIDLRSQLKLAQTYLNITEKELDFLNANKVISGKNNELNVINLKEASQYYGAQLKTLKLKEVDQEDKVRELKQEIEKLENQRNQLAGEKEFPSGEIVIKVESRANTTSEFELSYMVHHAGWFPSYDIRAKSISDPVDIIYKANVHQDTKVDWQNVTLKFSSSDPNLSGVIPEMNPYFLSYNYRPSGTRKTINEVTGIIMDSSGEPLPGANVMVEGTTIGTVTDVSGRYSLMLPSGSNELTISFIGYDPITITVTKNVINARLRESAQALEEVVITGYGSKSLNEALQGRVAGVDISTRTERLKKKESISVPFSQTENQTTVEFEISVPYSIKSDKKTYAVEMAAYSLPASYQYFCIPKIEKDAFLLANIVDWENYSFLEGEANIFFEDTYIGKTIMDVRYAKDTLQISLGRDKHVVVTREKVKDKTSNQFIGSKKEVNRAWEIKVKNNKSQEISMLVMDQVPVPQNEEIEVEINDRSGSKLNEKTGELHWEFELNPGKEKAFDLNYTVKYPKSRTLYIE